MADIATWVVGDVHGMYNTFLNLLNHLDLKEDDKVILIGDIIDRGKDPYKMLKWAMENVTEDGRYQMILGNHEDNIIFDYYSKLDNRYSRCTEKSDIICLESQYGFDVYMYSKGFETLGSVRPFVEWFEALPLYKKVTVTKPDGTEQKYVIAHAWFDRKDSENRNTLLWVRDIVPGNRASKGKFIPDYDGEDNEILIHGHTPVFREHGYPDDAVVYFREHSINIDCGACFQRYGGMLAAIRLEDQKIVYANEKICVE